MRDKYIKIIVIAIPIILFGMFFFDKFSPKSKQKENVAEVINADSAASVISEIEKTDTLKGYEYYLQKLSEIYTSEIGIHELTGNNDGKRVEEYLASCGLKKGNAWCAAFVNWCHVQAGINGANSAYSPNWFPKENTIYTHGTKGNLTPSKADILGIYYKEKSRIAHVGFIDEWGEGDYCITVEGNTNDAGSREGDGVYKKRRLKNQIYKISRWL